MYIIFPAFVDSLRCWNKVNAANEAMTCDIQPFYSKVIQYVTGQKHIFDEKDEFCRYVHKP
jgi:hypothetical protein